MLDSSCWGPVAYVGPGILSWKNDDAGHCKSFQHILWLADKPADMIVDKCGIMHREKGEVSLAHMDTSWTVDDVLPLWEESLKGFLASLSLKLTVDEKTPQEK